MRHGRQNSTAAPSVTGDREHQSSIEENSPSPHCGSVNSKRKTRDPLQCPRQENGTNQHDHDDELVPTHCCRMTTPSNSDNEEKPKEIGNNLKKDGMELTSDVTLHWSDDVEEVTSGDSLSPVFPAERPLHHPENHTSSLGSPRHSSPVLSTRKSRFPVSSTQDGHTSPSKLTRQPQEPPATDDHRTVTTKSRPVSHQSLGAVSGVSDPLEDPKSGTRVHYYWGVPFCPHGRDPDAYTQVILAQMEVYEKSLKQAQRGLLRKATWGEAILPMPEKSSSSVSHDETSQPIAPKRSGLTLRGKRAASPKIQEGEEQEGGEERQMKNDCKEEDEQAVLVDVDDTEVCPETQLSDDGDSTQELIMAKDASPEVQYVDQAQPQPTDQDQQQEEEVMEVDGADRANIVLGLKGSAGPANRERERDVLVRSPNKGHNVWIEEEEEERTCKGLQGSVPHVPGPAMSPVRQMVCPICQGSFPMVEIEMHAAYCNGEGDTGEEVRWIGKTDFQASLTPRKKRSKRAEVAAPDRTEHSDFDKPAEKREKCYICQKAIPLRDYKRHTEDCIQQRSVKAAMKGNLLTALEQTESRDSDAGPSCSDFSSRPREVIDLVCRDEDEDETPSLRVSDSPIRSFTSISEATDSLVDFRNQYSARQPSQRRQRGGFKRKLKR
ncbi:BRCA1-A complex subunit RAP80 isoform X2 [Lampris incognitus]|uniref:BRCA1-A complex subunit RAP80 isoform X2 n=1 Tax=Lampris incognitus TaxID=2546036 RepID=UPI0024B4EB3E|nr:BRCA1-A complex subunit RAP80 isoform X2 [Lampris incognitus]